MSTTYAADTAANQAVVQQTVNSLRSFAIDYWNLMQKYAALEAFWFNGNPTGSTPSALITGYTSNSDIPNTSNLAGSTDVTPAQIETVQGYLQTLLGNNTAAVLNSLVSMAGPSNLL